MGIYCTLLIKCSRWSIFSRRPAYTTTERLKLPNPKCDRSKLQGKMNIHFNSNTASGGGSCSSNSGGGSGAMKVVEVLVLVVAFFHSLCFQVVFLLE